MAFLWSLPYLAWDHQQLTNLFLFLFPSDPEADMVAEIGLEELNGLEMEVMRRQVSISHWEGRSRILVSWGRWALATMRPPPLTSS